VTNGSGTVMGANVSSVAVRCLNVGRFVFIANFLDGTNGTGDVSAYTINSQTGALTAVAGGPVAADGNPGAIVVDPSGSYAYVANRNTSDVSLMYIDPTAGTLTLHRQFYSPGTGGTSIALAPSGQDLFVGGYGSPAGSVFAFTAAPTSGLLTAGTNSPVAAGNTPYGIAVDPTGQFVFATASFGQYLYVYSVGSGAALTQVPNSFFYTGSGPYGVAVSPLGTANGGFVYTAGSAVNQVTGFSYDGTGNLTQLPSSPVPAGSQPKGIAIDPLGTYLYVTNYGDGTVSSYSINAQSGALTAVGTAVSTGNINSVPNPAPIDVKVDPSGQYVYVVNYLDASVSLFTAQAGVLTLQGTYPAGTEAIAAAVY
jgi:6-phosphogluconolactonase (cycloisomerase 2 family)